MTTLWQKKRAAVECCCRCIGACWPYVCDGTFCTLQSIPWEISAPNCDAINGAFGSFDPFGDGTVREFGPCGPCNCFESIGDLQLPVKRYLQIQGGGPGGGDDDIGGPEPPPICSVIDDFILLQLFLATDDVENEDCCNVKLIVHLRQEKAFGLELCAGEPLNASGLLCIPSVANAPPANFRMFSPVSCECLPNNQGLAATFDLSEIQFCCPLGNWDGICSPNSRCPVLFQCSLNEATLTL